MLVGTFHPFDNLAVSAAVAAIPILSLLSTAGHIIGKTHHP
ncbi:hypothetical protein [Peribacillus deserti]|nr:hypothetical protein [Peribacillus deserti]